MYVVNDRDVAPPFFDSVDHTENVFVCFPLADFFNNFANFFGFLCDFYFLPAFPHIKNCRVFSLGDSPAPTYGYLFTIFWTPLFVIIITFSLPYSINYNWLLSA